MIIDGLNFDKGADGWIRFWQWEKIGSFLSQVTNLKNYEAGVEKSAQMGDIFSHHNYDPENATYYYYRVRTANTTNTLLTHY